MRLTALVENPEHVCCRYRLAAFRPLLERAGHSLELCSWPRRWWSRLWMGGPLGQSDVVIVQRKLLPAWELFLLRRSARRLVFDFDDAVFLRDSYSARGLYSGRRKRRFASVIRFADRVVAGNAFLRHQAASWTDAEQVHIIPTCVDVAQYPRSDHVRAGNGVQLVWVGSSSTLRGLKAIQPMLEDVGQRWPGLRLKLICDRFFRLRNLQVLPCPWSEATEGGLIAAGDIGISWVPDDDWSRGKCGLKVLQYMAAGLPVVANPVGVQAEMVRHGETGFLVETADQWSEAIGQLALDPGLRRRMGQAARQRVEAEFSVAVGAQHWLRLLDELQGQRAAA